MSLEWSLFLEIRVCFSSAWQDRGKTGIKVENSLKILVLEQYLTHNRFSIILAIIITNNDHQFNCSLVPKYITILLFSPFSSTTWGLLLFPCYRIKAVYKAKNTGLCYTCENIFTNGKHKYE